MLPAGGHSWSRVFIKDIWQLRFFKISRYRKLVVGNRVEAYTGDRAIISVGWPEASAPCPPARFSVATIIRIRIGNPGKSRKSGIFVFAASQNSDLIDWSCVRTAAPFG